jgi:hypothetical protein
VKCSLAFLLALFASLPLGANAQHIYSCRDKSGRMITSDQPIPECANLPMQERSKGGLLLKDIPAPLTPEQQAAADQAAKQRLEEEDEARDQHRKDLLLMSTYSDEQSIEVARTRSLADYEDSLKQARTRLTSLVADRDALRKETAPYHGKPLPTVLQRRADALDAEIAGESKNIDDRKRDIARINSRFDTDLARFKVLEAQSASANNVRH